MSKSKSKALLLTFTVVLTGLSSTSLFQVPQAAYSQTDYEEYLITETNTEQELNQQNIGSGSSTNINCGTNIVGTNLAQPIKCPNVPGETPPSNEEFATITVSSVPVDATLSATAEVSCPEGTEVTGGGYDVRANGMLVDDVVTREDAPTDNGWKVSVHTGGTPGTLLTVYAVCGALGDIPVEPVEICDDGIDNDGDTLVDIADPDCAGPPPPPDTDSDGVRDTIDNCDNIPNPGQEDADGDGIGDACDEIPNPVEVCDNGIDDDGDDLIDIDDPDCQPPGEEFRFELINCERAAGDLICDGAEQTSPLPPTYNDIGCVFAPGSGQLAFCDLGRIDGGDSDRATCNISSNFETAVCFVETDD